MFVDLDIKHHASRRRETAQLFSISTLMNIEYQLDPVMKFFFEKLDAFADGGEPLDMAAWLQYYAFDAVGALTVSSWKECLPTTLTNNDSSGSPSVF